MTFASSFALPGLLCCMVALLSWAWSCDRCLRRTAPRAPGTPADARQRGLRRFEEAFAFRRQR